MRLNRHRGASSLATLIILAIVIAIVTGGIFSILWYTVAYKPLAELERSRNESSARAYAASGEKIRLDARYADADGDLVADLPTDAAKLKNPATLVISYVAEEDPGSRAEAMKELAAHLEAKLSKPVKVRQFTSFTEQAAAMRDGELHVSVFATGAVPLAVTSAGFVPFGMLGSETGGTHRMQVIVPQNSTIGKLQDLRGRTLLLTEPSSNSGYKAAIVALREQGMVPLRDYQIVTSGGHDLSVKILTTLERERRSVEAAAVASDVLQRAKDAGPHKVIYESAPFPSAGVGLAHDLDAALAASIRKIVLDYRFSGELKKQFEASGQDRFVPATYKGDWAEVVKIAESFGLARPE